MKYLFVSCLLFFLTSCSGIAGLAFTAASSAKTAYDGVNYVDKKEILTGTIDSMSREEVEKKLQDLKEQYSIETTFEEVKELENKS